MFNVHGFMWYIRLFLTLRNGISGVQSVVVSSSWMMPFDSRLFAWYLPDSVSAFGFEMLLFTDGSQNFCVCCWSGSKLKRCWYLFLNLKHLRKNVVPVFMFDCSAYLNGSVLLIKNVWIFIILRWLSRLPPSPGSTSYVSFKHFNVASDMWTRLWITN